MLRVLESVVKFFAAEAAPPLEEYTIGEIAGNPKLRDMVYVRANGQPYKIVQKGFHAKVDQQGTLEYYQYEAYDPDELVSRADENFWATFGTIEYQSQLVVDNWI